MIINMIGSFVRNHPFGSEIAFAKGLKQIGVAVNTWDPSRQDQPEWEPDADATIMFKDHGYVARSVMADAKAAGSMTIEYQPDDIRAPGIEGMMRDLLPYCDYAFTFDDRGAREAVNMGYDAAMPLLVTADPDVYYPIDELDKDIDLCFVGSMSNSKMHASRSKMIKLLKSHGLNVHAETTFDAARINELYNRSKVVLNHATDVGQGFGKGYGYQCRHFEVGFTYTCLLSNVVIANADDGGPHDFCIFYDETSLIRWADYLLEDDRLRSEFASLSYMSMCREHSPERRAEQIVEFVERGGV